MSCQLHERGSSHGRAGRQAGRQAEPRASAAHPRRWMAAAGSWRWTCLLPAASGRQPRKRLRRVARAQLRCCRCCRCRRALRQSGGPCNIRGQQAAGPVQCFDSKSAAGWTERAAPARRHRRPDSPAVPYCGVQSPAAPKDGCQPACCPAAHHHGAAAAAFEAAAPRSNGGGGRPVTDSGGGGALQHSRACGPAWCRLPVQSHTHTL